VAPFEQAIKEEKKEQGTNQKRPPSPPKKRVLSLAAALSLSSPPEKITDRTSLGRAIDHVLYAQVWISSFFTNAVHSSLNK